MRILIFSEDYNKGFESFIRNHYTILNRGHDAEMVFLGVQKQKIPEGYVLQSRWKKGVSSWYDKITFIFPFLRNVLLRNDLDQLCEEFSPEILHFHFGSRTVKYLDQFKLNARQPIFVTFHGIDASHFFKASAVYRKKIARLLRKQNVFPIFVSNALLANAAKYNLPTQRARVCYLGIDTAYFKPTRQPSSTVRPKVFLQIARLVAKKGQLVAIRAFEKIHRELNAELHLVGSGPIEKELRREIEQLDLSKMVKLFPACDKVGVRRYMNESDIFVHPSCTPESGDMEGLPTVIMEAMAMEMPILSTVHSGIPELVTHEENGLLGAENDVGQLAANMLEIAEWGYLEKNRKKVVEQFDLEQQNKKLLEIYQQQLRD